MLRSFELLGFINMILIGNGIKKRLIIEKSIKYLSKLLLEEIPYNYIDISHKYLSFS